MKKIVLLIFCISHICFAQTNTIENDTAARQQAIQRLQPRAETIDNEFVLNDGQYHSAVVLGYNMATAYKYNNMRVLGGAVFPVTGSYEGKVSPAFNIGYRGYYLPHHSMGMLGTLSYEQNREISSENFNYGTISTNASYSSKPIFQIILLEANVAYRWKRYYVNIGANYSKPTFISSGSSGNEGNLNGATGFQLGTGLLFNKFYVADLQLKTIAVQGTYHQGTTTFVLGDGYLTGFEVHIGYIF